MFLGYKHRIATLSVFLVLRHMLEYPYTVAFAWCVLYSYAPCNIITVEMKEKRNRSESETETEGDYAL